MRKELMSPLPTKKKLPEPSEKGVGQIEPKLGSAQWNLVYILVGNTF